MDLATIVLDGLTLILDVLTLFIVIASFKAIRDNNRRSQEALAEDRRQAQAALDVAHEQIEQGKQQSQEILYNQNKPIIIWHTPTASSSSAKKLGSSNDAHIYNLDIENVGTGIATNIWSVLCITGQPPFICTYSRVLVPNRI